MPTPAAHACRRRRHAACARHTPLPPTTFLPGGVGPGDIDLSSCLKLKAAIAAQVTCR